MTIRSSAWPPACEHIEGNPTSGIVLICEHASNFIPAEYGGLGLDGPALRRHIAWDIGAAEVTRRLASRLDAPAFLGTYSRLLIDLNRPLDCADSIPLASEGTAIPGNAGLGIDEVARRQSLIFSAFHKEVEAYLERRKQVGGPTKLVTIHSFTPVYLGVSRPWHAGILFGRSKEYANQLLMGLRRDPLLNATLNQPYFVSRDSDYAIPIHGDDRDIEAVLFEIRNDLIDDEGGAERWADRLASILSSRHDFDSPPRVYPNA